MRTFLMLIVAGLLATGCRTTDPPRTQFTQTADNSYAYGAMGWKSGETTYVFFKTLEHNDRVGFCAYAVSGREDGGDTESRMFSQRTLTLDGVPLGSAAFIPVYTSDVSRSVTAHCIETAIAWERSWANAQPYFEGPQRVRSLD